MIASPFGSLRIGVAAALLGLAGTVPAQADVAETPSRRLPIAFVENGGQWSADVAYVARAASATTWFHRAGWSVHRGGSRFAMWFDGARASAPLGEGPLAARYHFLGGQRHVIGVHACRALSYRALYPGVDVAVRDGGGCLEYDLHLRPGADARQIDVRCEGVQRLAVDQEGGLVAFGALGAIHQPPPRTWWVDAAGVEQRVACRYVLHGGCHFGFEVVGRPADAPLVIDPGIVWSTFLGGGFGDEIRAVASAGNGETVVVGRTASTDLPVTAGALQTTLAGGSAGGGDAFVAKIAADGSSLLWCTYLGGSFDDGANAVSVGPSGDVAIAGSTASADFPTTPNAYDRALKGYDAFAARLDASGSQLLYGTLLRGSGAETGDAVYYDEASNGLYVAGTTDSTDIPTTSTALQAQIDGGSDGYLVVLDVLANQTRLRYATYFGGAGAESAVTGMQVDPSGVVTLGGATGSSNFDVTPGAAQSARSGAADGFVLCLQPALAGPAGLLYGSFVGGSAGGDVVTAVHRSSQGMLTIVGRTDSTDLPLGALRAPLQGAFGGGATDGFLWLVDTGLSGGAALLYGSYYGGSGADGFSAVAVSGSGVATAGGASDSSDLRGTVGSAQELRRGGVDGLVVRIDPFRAGSASLLHATFLGGCGGDDRITGILVDKAGAVTAAGVTASSGFPVTPGSAQCRIGGAEDGFVTRLDPTPYPQPSVLPFGVACPGTFGQPKLEAVTQAQVCLSYDVRASNLTPAQAAWVMFGVSRSQWGPIRLPVGLAPIGLPACTLYVSGEVVTLATTGNGTFDWGFKLPDNPFLVGYRFYNQVFFADPLVRGGFAVTNALEATIRL